VQEEWERRERSGATVDLMGVVVVAVVELELERRQVEVEARLEQNLTEVVAEEESEELRRLDVRVGEEFSWVE